MVIIEVNKEQFFKAFPPETRNITINGEVISELGEEVICDHCNGDVFYHTDDGVVPNAFLLSYEENPTQPGDIHDVLCKECAEEFIKKNGMSKN